MGFYLPLTEIQFRAEELEYSSLLDAAAQAAPGSVQRATLVAGFALSHYAATVRLDKPFLPMHGETFDIYLPEKGVRVLAETVYTNFKENTCVVVFFFLSFFLIFHSRTTAVVVRCIAA